MQDHNAVVSEKKGIFYGYAVMAACSITVLMVFGTNYCFGVFFKPMSAYFDWSKAVTSGAFSLNALVSGFLGLFAGHVSDRYGGRIIAVICAFSLGGGFILLSGTSFLWQFYLYYMLVIGIGMGFCWPGLMVMPARWFKARRGLMTGLVAAGGGIGAHNSVGDTTASFRDYCMGEDETTPVGEASGARTDTEAVQEALRGPRQGGLISPCSRTRFRD